MCKCEYYTHYKLQGMYVSLETTICTHIYFVNLIILFKLFLVSLSSKQNRNSLIIPTIWRVIKNNKRLVIARLIVIRLDYTIKII